MRSVKCGETRFRAIRTPGRSRPGVFSLKARVSARMTVRRPHAPMRAAARLLRIRGDLSESGPPGLRAAAEPAKASVGPDDRTATPRAHAQRRRGSSGSAVT